MIASSRGALFVNGASHTMIPNNDAKAAASLALNGASHADPPNGGAIISRFPSPNLY